MNFDKSFDIYNISVVSNHYVDSAVLIKLLCISVISSNILSILFMNFIYKLLTLKKVK